MKKKTNILRKWWFWPAAVVGLIALASLVFMVLPDSTNVEFSDLPKTTYDATIEDLVINISSNKLIRSVKLTVKSGDTTTELEPEIKGFLTKKKLSLDELTLIPGKHTIKVTVFTIFGGEYTQRINVTSDVGYVAAPDEESFVYISSDTYLISNELLVLFKEDASEREIKKLVSKYNGTIVGSLPSLKQYQIRFEDCDEYGLSEYESKLAEESLVEIVTKNYAHLSSSEYYPNDSKFDSWNTKNPDGNNWGLECIDAPGAWDYMDRIKSVKVGVIDTLLDYDHEDLNIDPSAVYVLPNEYFQSMSEVNSYYSSLGSSCVNTSTRDHGTHCTGLVGAIGDNKQGGCGVNWKAELYFSTYWYLRRTNIEDQECYSTRAALLFNIARAVRSGCRVISISVGSVKPSEPDANEIAFSNIYEDLIIRLENEGYDFLIFKSAGNDNDDAGNYALNRIMTYGEHARAHTVIVGAVSNHTCLNNNIASWLLDDIRVYNLAYYSNSGDLIDVCAPGSIIYSTVFDDKYSNMSGTSMATPMAAGVASLVYGANPNLTYSSVKAILSFTANDYCGEWYGGSTVYPIVNAKNAVEWALNHTQSLPEREEPEFGYISGIVLDAVTGLPLTEMTVTATLSDGTGPRYISGYENLDDLAELRDGSYFFHLPPGTYDMTFYCKGYITETIYNVEIVGSILNYNVMLNMVKNQNIHGYADGQIIDAFDGIPIPNAEINIYQGINSSTDWVISITADNYGYYSIELPPGNYTIEASANGYTTGTANLIILPGETSYNQNCTLTPVLKEGEIRAILTWGSYPTDLDSHLTGPTVSGGSFHIYYEAMNYIYGDTLYNRLDVDDTTSYGPETTSVYVGVSGTYTYYVHNYSDRERSSSSSLSTSHAQVKLYIAGKSQPYVFNVPNSAGTLWKVFSLEDGQLIIHNEMSYEKYPDKVGR